MIALPSRLHLTSSFLSDPLGTIQRLSTPTAVAHPVPAGLTELEQFWWNRARIDIESNIVVNRYFGAGREFGPTVFTRDLSLSGVLSLNALYPEIMWQSLRYDRELRDQVGWKVTLGSSAAVTTPLPFEETPLDYDAFVATYHTGEFSRRTDDVVWLWAAIDWLQRHGRSRSDWEWAYATGTRNVSDYYEPFFDPDDGLYRGQACFVDIMMCGYPSQSQPEHPGDATDFQVHHVDRTDDPARWKFGRFPTSLRRSILGKAASTNALYILGFDALARMAAHLNRTEESDSWQNRADALRAAIRREFLRPDRAIRYHKECDGSWNDRQHALGTALCVLADVVTGSEAQQALSRLPVQWGGFPLFDPFYTDNPHIYHNRSTWPFVDGFVCRAMHHVGMEGSVTLWRALCGRCCRDKRGFRELCDAQSGEPLGSSHQLWSAAAYCGGCLTSNT